MIHPCQQCGSIAVEIKVEEDGFHAECTKCHRTSKAVPFNEKRYMQLIVSQMDAEKNMREQLAIEQWNREN